NFCAYYRYQPRRLDPTLDRQHACIPHPKIHESVIWRMAAGTDMYAPINLPPAFRIVFHSSVSTLHQQHGAAMSKESYQAQNISAFADYQQIMQKGESMFLTELGPDVSLKRTIVAKIQELQKPDQEAIDLTWDTVWWRRLIFFATFLATAM